MFFKILQNTVILKKKNVRDLNPENSFIFKAFAKANSLLYNIPYVTKYFSPFAIYNILTDKKHSKEITDRKTITHRQTRTFNYGNNHGIFLKFIKGHL